MVFDLIGMIRFWLNHSQCDNIESVLWAVSMNSMLHVESWTQWLFFCILPGVPLPVIGFVMYGLVTALSAQLAEGNLPFGVSKTNGRFALFAATTTMASASAYFLYILNTKLSGSSCLYCLVSAFLSFTLFFLAVKVSLYIRFSYILCKLSRWLLKLGLCLFAPCMW